MTEIDHEFTDEIVCPYCGEEMTSFDYEDDETIECEVCGKWFISTRNITIDYTTEKCGCMNGESPHQWKRSLDDSQRFRCKKCNCERPFSQETRDYFEAMEND